jgi:ssDNA-binding Zn-finger/Zn-ribbon topoisomerase 1
VVSPRFANAFAEVAGGGSLTSVRTSADKAGSVVARFDRCASCGEPASLTVGGSFYVTLDCGSCGAERWPTLVELESWAWSTGFGCPTCSGAVKAKRGKSRPFLSCAGYPKCDGMAYVSDLVGRTIVPVDRRPDRPVTKPKKSRAAGVAVGRAKGGHKVADLAEFDDYGIDRADAEAWLDLGLKAEHAVDLVGKGMGPAEAAERIDAGLEPLELWRVVRRGS